MNIKRLATLKQRAERGASSGDIVSIGAGELMTLVDIATIAIEARDHLLTHYPRGLASLDGVERDLAQRMLWALRGQE